MGSLGAIFRREREAKGISLEEISEKTKIGARLLRAIENEQFDRLPGGIFNKSFVRQYARILGIDEDIAVREYLQSFRSRQPLPPQRSRPLETQNSSAPGEYSRMAAGVAALVVLVAGIAYGAYRLHAYLTAVPSAAENRAGASSTVPPVVSPSPASAETLTAPAADSEPASVSTDSDLGSDYSSTEANPPGLTAEETEPPSDPVAAGLPTPLAAAPEELQLRIDSHGPVWLSITADGARQWQGTMRPNQTREVHAVESVRLTVGDAAAVSLTLNGRTLPGLGRPGEVRNLTITARDATESAP